VLNIVFERVTVLMGTRDTGIPVVVTEDFLDFSQFFHGSAGSAGLLPQTRHIPLLSTFLIN
jgi:hypothetical protein